MKYKKNSRRRALEYEKDLVQYWKKNKTFEKSVEMRPASNSYVFYDGPPFITGVPHHGTLLSSIVKDAVPRYQTMKGKRVERVWGWDCHGLPAEVFTEKKLGIVDKRDIGTKVTLEEYINTCRQNMVQTGSEWEDTIDRIGRWVDFKGAYKTMDKEYMESVWWAFKELYEKGKIYEGEKVLLYCTRDATPISKAEVAMDNSYQDVTDPSVYVKLRLKDHKSDLPTYLLAWTTTPWTLPANTAAAVNEHEEYAEIQVGDEVFIFAAELADKVLTDEKHNVVPHTILRKFKGKELINREYEPLFVNRGKNAHRVWHADYVTLEEGTGVVHLAPAYGEEDYALARKKGFPFVSVIDDNGYYSEGDWKGEQVWEINKTIAKTLLENGVVWKIDYIRHSYPHCHRCGTKLMYRAHPSWFMNVIDQKQEMLIQNGHINWFPKHIKQGRFAKTIESAPDWNLSRDRFWATAMPVWKGTDKEGKEVVKVIGSYEELKELSGQELEDYHRPWIDDVTFEIDGVEYKRVDKVLDSWFESGSMPFAQFHYPFENQEKFEQNYPADFIVEYVGQVRAWFYYLHAVSVGLRGSNTFKNVIVTGTLAGNDGRKMSKSYGNYTDPNELMDKFSADSLRFLLLSSPVLNAEDYSLQDKDVGDVARKLTMVWNMYDFFTLYADVDQWDSGLGEGELPSDPSAELTNPLDKWIISRVHELTEEVDRHMQAYDIPNAVKPILPFIDDASNWYVRRSRKRFWKSDNDSDKNDAYRSLHYVLIQLSLVMAPFTPFLAEELYRNLTSGESVHLLDWPDVGHIDQQIVRDMAVLRGLITEGLAQRAEAGIKVRQPLADATIRYLHADRLEPFIDIVKEELNLKQVELDGKQPEDAAIDGYSISLNTHISIELKHEGIVREIIRNVQQARKKAGLEVDDRIELSLVSESEQINQVLANQELRQLLKHETLTETVVDSSLTDGYNEDVKIEAELLQISLKKVDK